MKQIQFTHRNLLLSFVLGANKEVVEISRGINREPVNPMSRDYVTYQTILRNKLGGLIDRL